MTMCSKTTTLLSLFRLSQISDSAFPVGSFSFSMGLEAAVAEGIVRDSEGLEEYTRGALYAAAEGDGIALLEAFRAASAGELSRLPEIDQRVYAMKPTEEGRKMSVRMGGRLAGLIHSIAPSSLTATLGEWIHEGHIVGTYPTAQAVAGVELSTGEEALFAAHLYGVASMILSAALRLMRLSHFESQRILYHLGPLCQGLYERYRHLTIEDMCSFSPTVELCCSLHERGKERLFMN